MATTIERIATAAVSVVTIDASAEHGSTVTMAYFESVEDARVAAVAMIAARGWRFVGDWDGNDRLGHRARFAAGEVEGEMMLDADGNHVGAIYAFALSTPATVTRESRY